MIHRQKIYLAGELFSLKHLSGNVALAQALEKLSADKYQVVLPQELEQRNLSAKAIRDYDLKALLECQAAIFNFDGTEIDSGTVVEYVLAKMYDIPSVIVRTDSRAAGDNSEYDWNLMLTGFPRVAVVCQSAFELYRISNKDLGLAYAKLAEEILISLEQLLEVEPCLSVEERANFKSTFFKLININFN